MIRTKITLLLLLFTIVAYSQQEKSLIEPEQAKTILDNAANKIKKSEGIEADFSLIINNKQANVSDSSSGSIQLKGEKYHLSMMNTETFFDGTTQWTYMKDDNEVNISTPEDDDEEDLTPNTIFTLYEKGFNFSYKGEANKKGNLYYIVDMYPENKEKQYFKVRVEIDKSTENFHSFTTYGKDGVENTIVIDKIDLNKGLNDSSFSFYINANQNVDVIDLR